MSKENVEIVRRLFDAVARRDATSIFALYDPEVQLDTSRSPWTRLVGAGRVYQGHSGLRDLFSTRNDVWEDIEDICDELLAADDHVVSISTMRGRGKSSGVEVELPQYGVWRVREGKIVWVAWVESREAALEAAGLSE